MMSNIANIMPRTDTAATAGVQRKGCLGCCADTVGAEGIGI
jgi:hypothetical protein